MNIIMYSRVVQAYIDGEIQIRKKNRKFISHSEKFGFKIIPTPTIDLLYTLWFQSSISSKRLILIHFPIHKQNVHFNVTDQTYENFNLFYWLNECIFSNTVVSQCHQIANSFHYSHTNNCRKYNKNLYLITNNKVSINNSHVCTMQNEYSFRCLEKKEAQRRNRNDEMKFQTNWMENNWSDFIVRSTIYIWIDW